MTPAERKRRQRELDAREGIREVSVRVPSDQAEVGRCDPCGVDVVFYFT
jgi:hypothetical protein